MQRNLKDSQNFLHSKALVQKLVEKSNINEDDLVYEIGPGKGIITEQLLKKSKKVIAIELDKQLFLQLKEKLNNKSLTLINADFLKYNISNDNYKVFSNIPFNMTSDILTKLLTNINPPKDMYIIMQYEATLKYAGDPYYKDTLKSLMFKPMYDIKIIHRFDKYDFKPAPNVTIVLTHFHKKEFCDIKKATMLEYWDFLSYVYSASGLTFKEKTKKIFSYEQQKRIRKNLNLNEETFISDWTYEQWLKLFNVYNQMVSIEKKQLVKGAYNKLLNEQSKLQKMHRNRAENNFQKTHNEKKTNKITKKPKDKLQNKFKR